jgi:hypothetical protein
MTTAAAAEPAAGTGYTEIAAVTGRALFRSVSVRTAKRWAVGPNGARPRLPVYISNDGAAYITRADLDAFVAVWTGTAPPGGRLPRGARVALRGTTSEATT